MAQVFQETPSMACSDGEGRPRKGSVVLLLRQVVLKSLRLCPKSTSKFEHHQVLRKSGLVFSSRDTCSDKAKAKLTKGSGI